MKERVEVWAPATVANMNVGFDALGCALSAGERMIVHRTSDPGVVRIRAIHGAALDLHPERNVASIAANSLLNPSAIPVGWKWKFQVDSAREWHRFQRRQRGGCSRGRERIARRWFAPEELIPFALDGESFASGARHADNVAPALLGGLVICPPEGPPIAIPALEDWSMVVLHPQIPIKTVDARAVCLDKCP